MRNSQSVFEQRVLDTPGDLSERSYNFIIGTLLAWGFFLTSVIQSHFHDLKITWPILIGYFVSCIAGIILSKTRVAFLSLIGYHLIVAPIGVIIGPFIAAHSGVQIQHALLLTGGMTCAMLGAATIWPAACRGMGSFLFWSLLGLIGFEILNATVFHLSHHWGDYAGAIIFSAYIAYDWAEAQSKTRSLDNAVESVVELYLSLINLFISLLSASDDD